MKNPLKTSLLLVPLLTAMMAFSPHVSVQMLHKGVIGSFQNIDESISKSVNVEACTPNAASSFQSGEQLIYKIYYNLNFVWIPAGEVTFKITDEGAQYHLAAIGRTYGSYEWFYKVRDNYDTYVEKTTMLPTLSIRNVNEGNYKLYDKVTYDQKNKKAFYERGHDKSSIDKRGLINLNDCMHDVLSVVYYSRTLDYTNAKVGQEFPIKLMLDEEVLPLKYKFLGNEEKKIKDQGKWSTIKISPQVVSGHVFKEGTEMKIWASNDANKIPLMIESPVSVGSVKIVLKEWKGLKYDVTAKKD